MKKIALFLCTILLLTVPSPHLAKASYYDTTPSNLLALHSVFVLADPTFQYEGIRDFGYSGYFHSRLIYRCGETALYRLIHDTQAHYYSTVEEKEAYFQRKLEEWSQLPGVIDVGMRSQWIGEATTGDTNGDGNVTAEDALLCLRISVNKQELTDLTQFFNGFYPYDPYATADDRLPTAANALKILQKTVGK